MSDGGRKTRGSALDGTLTHGTLMRMGSWYVIACEPHVKMRLVRWMQKVDPHGKGEVRIRRTPEVAADLQTFVDRFPLEMTAEDRLDLHRGAESFRSNAKVVAQVLAGEYVPRAFEMAVVPRDYQRVAADLWLRRCNLILGDDTGVGKTGSAITGLSDPSTRPALVVTPGGAIPFQWQDALAKWLPGLRTHVLQGTTPYDIVEACAKEDRRAKLHRAPAFPDVLIAPYTRLDGWAGAVSPKIRSVVFDEAQKLRHRDSATWRAANRIATSPTVTHRLGLTATPTVNYGGEFWNVAANIVPDALGTREEFDREWTTSAGEERKRMITDPTAFGLYLRESGILLRRTRKDVGREMPPLTIVPMHIEADMEAIGAIKGRAFELARTILSQQGGIGAGKIQRDARGELDRIVRQATGVAKAPYLAAFVRLLIESGEPVLLGLWHRSVYDIVGEVLKDLKPAFYTGAESTTQKRESLRRFTAKETPLLCMSLRSGEAIDGLQYACRTVVIGELDWSHVIHHQLISRVDRDGQTDKVVAYYPMASVGSDPLVSDICGAKRANSDPIRNPDAKMVAEVTVDPEHVRRLAETFLRDHGKR